MIRLSLLLTLSFLLISGAPGASLPDSLRDYLQSRVDADDHPGIVVGVADADGQAFLSVGRVDQKTDAQLVDERTLFELGSISKTFTALLFQLAVDGKTIKETDPASGFMPADLALPPKTSNITLLELATHSSGLPRMPDNFKPANPRNPYADYTQAQFYQWLRGVELGEKRFQYSNAGMGWLGQILAGKAGTSYEALVKAWIITPCALTDTGIELTGEQKARAATPHQDGKPIPMWDIPTLAGAGALRGTAEDVLRWSALHAGLIESPLKGAMERVQRPRVSAGKRGAKVACGWMIQPSRNGNIVWHNGGTGGTRTWTGFNRKTRRAAVVLANSSVTVDDIGMHLLDADVPLRKVHKQVRLAKAKLEKCEGTYSFGDAELHVTVVDDRLGVQLTGQGVNPAYPESETRYFMRVVDAQLTFEEGANGQMKAVVLHQNGIDQRAERKK